LGIKDIANTIGDNLNKGLKQSAILSSQALNQYRKYLDGEKGTKVYTNDYTAVSDC
jgi:hypothetical protein